MKFTQAGKMAIAAVLSNKLRSFLTMLGIIIGVMSVTLLISLVQGATNTVTSSLDDLGGDQLVASISNTSKRLTLHEVEALEGSGGIARVSPLLNGKGTAKAAGNSTDISITGITSAYQEVQGMDLENGRYINQNDVEYRLNVCIVGSGVAKDLFGNTNILNETIRIAGKDYRVIGVREEAEETMFGSANDGVFLPFTNAQRLLSSVNITTFYVSTSDTEHTQEAKDALDQMLMNKYGDEDSYTIVNMMDIMDTINSVMSTLELLLGAIAGISLLVGGIGIMNIMLVSVTERTREIGIRKAIGAQKPDIIVQFLIESVIISLMGGLIGMGISQGILTLINTLYPGYNFNISGGVAGMALAFAIMVGVVFGIYPANKAAKLKPINALRYE
ncbi:MAG: ABC transporter permease [Lachnospiraceae bacterium]|nr:ABC transporter permease [Lachnospiraceae bacterium]